MNPVLLVELEPLGVLVVLDEALMADRSIPKYRRIAVNIGVTSLGLVAVRISPTRRRM
jgi:hypothetical protein